MSQSTIGVRVALDAGQAQSQMGALADAVDRFNTKLREATEAGDWTDAANITATINNLTMAQGNLARVPNDAKAGGVGSATEVQSSLGDRIVQAANQISNSMIQLGNGDFGGAMISAASGVGSGLRGVGKEIRKANPDSELGKVMGIAGVVLQAGSELAKAIHSLSEAYKEALPHMREYNAIFNPANREQIALATFHDKNPGVDPYGKGTDAELTKTYETILAGVTDKDIIEENKTRERKDYETAMTQTYGTGLSTSELLDAALKEASYSNIDSLSAITTASNSAKFAFANNADLDLVQDVTGRARKFGDKENAADAAYTAMKATGGNPGQMNEFLQAMSRVMEDGIFLL